MKISLIKLMCIVVTLSVRAYNSSSDDESDRTTKDEQNFKKGKVKLNRPGKRPRNQRCLCNRKRHTAI